MTPPERRKSGLTTRSPIAPPAPVAEVTPKAAPTPPSVEAAPVAPAAGPAAKRPKMGFFAASEEEAGRIRAAWQHTLTTGDGHNSLAQFERFAVMKLVAELEAKYNDGQPWPYLPSGSIRTGRPIGGN